MLEAKNLHKTYENGKRRLEVLKGIDLRVEKGEFVAIVGPSGAGKSTLLHILGGLDSPTHGKVIFEEDDFYGLSDILLCKIRNQKIGFVFQFYHLLSEFTVLENVLMPALIQRQAGSARDNVREGALKILAAVGLKERITHFPSQLSGGEQQRVAIARALMNSPQLLLCDEPTGNLDSKTGSDIVNLIKKINQERQMSVVLVTHNLELTKEADRVFHLKDGVLFN